MPDHENIYSKQAQLYERLICRQPSLLPAIRTVLPVEGLHMVDAGAGTGRLSAVLAPYAETLAAFDRYEPMLHLTEAKLAALLPPDRFLCAVADHRQLPLPDAGADLVTAGWSVCYLASCNHPDWSRSLEETLAEFRRILRPGGTIILFETMGTGTDGPEAPDFLVPYYRALEETYGFTYSLLPMPYTFDSVQEAAELTELFFGEEVSQRVKSQDWRIVPEWAGMWSLTV